MTSDAFAVFSRLAALETQVVSLSLSLACSPSLSLALPLPRLLSLSLACSPSLSLALHLSRLLSLSLTLLFSLPPSLLRLIVLKAGWCAKVEYDLNSGTGAMAQVGGERYTLHPKS